MKKNIIFIVSSPDKSVMGFAAHLFRFGFDVIFVPFRDLGIDSFEKYIAAVIHFEKYTAYREKKINSLLTEIGLTHIPVYQFHESENRKANHSLGVIQPPLNEKHAFSFCRNLEWIDNHYNDTHLKFKKELEITFEGFVESALASLEARDAYTSGHSRRVMRYSLSTASEINSCREGPFSDVFFSDLELRQLRYASLLHDIGKIGMGDRILHKRQRLSENSLKTVFERFDFIKHIINDSEISPREKKTSRREIDNYMRFIKSINTAEKLTGKQLETLVEIFSRKYKSKNHSRSYLTREEFLALSVEHGNLTDDEKTDACQHAFHTEEILSRIPWDRKMKKIARIAALHHEKMDGSGYPYGLKSREIPLQARIIAVSDVYDALTADNRPYRRPASPEKAVIILKEEAAAGKLDSNVVDLFISAEIFKKGNGLFEKA